MVRTPVKVHISVHAKEHSILGVQRDDTNDELLDI